MSFTRRGWLRGALVGLTASAILAVAFDAWFSTYVEREVRAEVRRAASPIAAALGAAADRRIALLAGLRSYTEVQGTRGALDESFPVFAQGIVASTDGVRALQLVNQGRIVATWPVEGNEAALGFNLYSHPDPAVVAGVRRALATAGVVITGPVDLVQGGVGLLVRGRLSSREGFPELATLVLDVPAIVRDAGIPSARSELYLEALDGEGDWFGGDSLGSALDPEELSVELADGAWKLLAAPRRGWAAVIAPRLVPSRIGSLGFIIAITLLGLMLGTRQDRLTRQVAASESKLGFALRAGTMGTWTHDLRTDQMQLDDDAARILGRPRSELLGASARAFGIVHPDDLTFVERSFAEALRSGRTDQMLEYRVMLPDGSSRWILNIAEIHRAPDGTPTRIEGVISDASARRDIEARLRHSERIETIGTLAGSVAHDFNNLLTAMVSFTELALEQMPLGATDAQVASARSDLQEVLRVASRASGLTGQLLAFSRRSAAEPQRVELQKALAELTPMLSRLLGERIALRVTAEGLLPPIWIDPGQLTQMVLNLVVNARDAIPQAGEISITGRLCAPGASPADAPQGTWVMLEVRDTGLGMSAAVRARIFEPYFSTKERAGGTGLGLSIVMGIVRAAGGHATVESTEGQGACFRIFLPLRPVTDEHPLPPREARA